MTNIKITTTKGVVVVVVTARMSSRNHLTKNYQFLICVMRFISLDSKILLNFKIFLNFKRGLRIRMVNYEPIVHKWKDFPEAYVNTDF